MSSSFRKRNVQRPIYGTRTSPQTGQVITSSGNPSLDVILGGGLPIGSICLIEEDKFVTYSKVLAKYFLAEGVLSQQSIFLGSLDDEPTELLRKLPKPLYEDELEQEKAADEQNGESTKNGLRIAWRYNDLPLVNSEQTTAKIGHLFNLSEPMDPMLIDYAETILWNDVPQCAIEEAGDLDTSDDHFLHNEIINDENIANNSQNEQRQQAQEKILQEDVEMQQVSDNSEAMKSEKENVNNVSADSNMMDNIDNNMDANNSNTAEVDVAGGYTAAESVDSMDWDPQKTASLSTNTSTATAASTAEADAATAASMLMPSTPPQKPKIFENERYFRILNEIHPLLREDRFRAGGMGQKSLCRVCITSLASPLWYDEQFPKDILKFLTILRAAVRSSVSVCFITMPMQLVAKCDTTLVAKIRNLVDYAIELESFAGSDYETNPAYKEYNGLLHLHKITAINTLTAYMPETTDLAFKLKRKKFVIEKLHLPPELQENGNESQRPSLSCSSSGSTGDIITGNGNSKALLDF